MTGDLNKVLSTFWDARTKWMEIGLQQGLAIGDLHTLQNTYNGNVDKCFIEMLALWLRSKLRPTLADLIAALRRWTVGFHQLAEELEREGSKNKKTTAILSCENANNQSYPYI